MLYLHLNNIAIADMDEQSYLNKLANELNTIIFNNKIEIKTEQDFDYFITILNNFLVVTLERDILLGIIYKNSLDGKPCAFKLVDNLEDTKNRGYIKLYG